jgi:hypothetical protein
MVQVHAMDIISHIFTTDFSTDLKHVTVQKLKIKLMDADED